MIGEAIDGRTYTRNAKQELVVELYKLAGRRNFSGFDFGVSLGWLFGKSSTPRP